MANTLSLLLIITFSVTASLSATQGKQSPEVDFSIVFNASKSENRFETDIGKPYALKTMDISTKFVKKKLLTYRNERKVGLVIQDMTNVFKTIGNQIYVSAGHIQNYNGNKSELMNEFTGILFSQMTRVWMFNASGTAPEIVLSGIADYVRLKAGYNTTCWVEEGGGENWNVSSDVTARFFAFCDYLTPGFVQRLSQELSLTKKFNIYAIFESYFGQKLDTMWRHYTAGNVPP